MSSSVPAAAAAEAPQQKRSSRRRAHAAGTANPQRVAQLREREYHSVNWMQCLLHHFDSQSATVQRHMRSCISHRDMHELTRFGVTVEQITAALTIACRLPEDVLASTRAIDYDVLGF